MDVLPERCLNGEGLLISKTNRGWVNLESKGKGKSIVETDFLLDDSGALKGKINFTKYGYDANSTRKLFFKEGEDKYFKDFQGQKTWEVNSHKFENAKEIEKPAVVKYDVQIPSHASVAGNQIYLNPFLNDIMIENPFKSEKREYPVDFGHPVEWTYLSKITIPEGYTPDEMPQSKIYAMPGNAAKFVYSVTVSGNLISIVRTLSINKSLFIQSEYPILREFYNQVVAKQNEQVVLKKTNN
jgi:hypothetical protein